jgi:hypothetical protein
MKTETDYRAIVGQCEGAEYVGRRGGVNLFRDVSTDSILSLYADALTPETIYLSCKAARGGILQAVEWEQVNEIERESPATRR